MSRAAHRSLVRATIVCLTLAIVIELKAVVDAASTGLSALALALTLVCLVLLITRDILSN